jgi:hypothetical protein
MLNKYVVLKHKHRHEDIDLVKFNACLSGHASANNNAVLLGGSVEIKLKNS